jgi:hypothetical protein
VFSCTTELTPQILVQKGPHPHYIGSTTSKKKSGTTYQIPYAERPLQAAQRLLQISGWTVHPNSKLSEYIEDFAVSRTDVPLPLLKTSTQQIIGGSIVHRLNDHVMKWGTLNNTRPNITSHIYSSTDKITFLSSTSNVVVPQTMLWQKTDLLLF